MFYGIINEGFLDIFKKKKKKNKSNDTQHQQSPYNEAKEKYNVMTSEEKDKFNKEFDKKRKELENLAKQELKKLMSDKKFKEELLKDIEEAFDRKTLDPVYDKEYYNTGKLPKTHVKVEPDYWEIIDDSQDVRMACSRIVDRLAEILEEKTDYDIGTGDGDEGCIYPEVFIDPILFFMFEYDA